MEAIKRDKQGKWARGNNSGQRFTRERSLGNQYAKGNPPNKTSFKEGENIMDKHPSWTGGVHHMTKDCIWVMLESKKRVRRPKLVWESVYGELPKGHVILHIDGNRYNDDINNLRAITRAELVILNNQK